MKEEFKKILDRLEREIAGKPTPDEYNDGINRAYSIVNEVAEEYKGDMKHNLAEMYAKNMVDYGVDVTKAWQTATQQSCALEKAYIRGRQYERDRFIELRKEYNNGWISCSERLPKEDGSYLVQSVFEEEVHFYDQYYDSGCEAFGTYRDYYDKNTLGFLDSEFVKDEDVVAWQPLPEPYKESED